MWNFGAFCDEYSILSRLYLKLELEPSRETVVHFLDQVRRAYPKMARLRPREGGALTLDEDAADDAVRRNLKLAPNSLKFGIFNPADLEAVLQFGKHVLTQAPVQLTLSDLDIDYLEVAYNFDLECRGNHDELIAETFYANHPLLAAVTTNQTSIIDCQPFVGVALTADCEQQLTVEIKARTTSTELRSGEYEPADISVVLAARQYWNAEGGSDLVAAHRQLATIGSRFAQDRIIPMIVQPLAAAIASRR